MCHLHWLLSGFPFREEEQQQTLRVLHHNQSNCKTNNKKTRRTTRTSSLNQLVFIEHGSDSVSWETRDLTMQPGLWNEALCSMTQIIAQQHHPGTGVTSCITAGMYFAWLGVYFEFSPIKAWFVLPRSLCLFFQEKVSIKIERTKRNLSQCETLPHVLWVIKHPIV